MEEWRLTNIEKDGRVTGHPFHIHVNPFQTQIKIDPSQGDDVENMRWQDTVTIPPNTTDANPLKIRQRFLTYDGKFVLHCHILVHEDLGMMQDITVNGSGIGPCVGVTTCNNTTNTTG